MGIKSENQQISIVLPKTYVEKLEKLAEYEFRTRSQQAAMIIIQYLDKIDIKNIES